ncbi:hypothetical protein CS063_10600 [Sporanaerobium hydrogeniformans]|uniref:Uncharacterized protein n=1 Tax=Sporanaerobium hydrogeniformans TaxID=3072179 RepID=A0AC61DC39_9FIRM|nr:heparan-alpha-glucosaminide N-acetyltransferase [Sporanaerobium hydrogeniformans]PHV70333.1 hypothetical protein CS063_10600 [Sporanaerobium hydrogeniformans]
MNKRIYWLDWLRGIAIIFMIIYHMIYQRVIWFSLSPDVLALPLVRFFQLGAQLLFISISGISCSFSKSNWKRGGICLGYGLIITLVTSTFFPEERIVFGILHFLGTAIILYSLIKPLVVRVQPYLGSFLCLLTFSLLYPFIYKGYYIKYMVQNTWVQHLWEKGSFNVLGFPSLTFGSADYFPLIPWFFLFLSGTFIGLVLKERPRQNKVPRYPLPVLTFMGKHSLLIYLLHIPAILGLFFIFDLLLP